MAKSMAKEVEISWDEPLEASDGEKAYGYVVYRFKRGEKIDAEQPKHIIHISFSAAQTSFIDTTVSTNQSYVYVVRAIDRIKNESEQSNAASISVKF